jgi:hypothetical protein
MRMMYTMSVMLFAISCIGCLDTRFIPILAERASIFAADYQNDTVPTFQSKQKDRLPVKVLPDDETHATALSQDNSEP